MESGGNPCRFSLLLLLGYVCAGTVGTPLRSEPQPRFLAAMGIKGLDDRVNRRRCDFVAAHPGAECSPTELTAVN